jgi:hypothetical protein
MEYHYFTRKSASIINIIDNLTHFLFMKIALKLISQDFIPWKQNNLPFFCLWKQLIYDKLKFETNIVWRNKKQSWISQFKWDQEEGLTFFQLQKRKFNLLIEVWQEVLLAKLIEVWQERLLAMMDPYATLCYLTTNF